MIEKRNDWLSWKYKNRANMLVESKGFQVEGFKIPPFKLKEGDIIVLYIGNALEAQSLKEKLFLLFSGKEKRASLVLNEKFEAVPNIFPKGIKEIFFPTTVKKYVHQNAKKPEDILSKLVTFDRIRLETKIITLPSRPRKLISLFTICSHTNKIIFDLDGLDPLGAENVFGEVEKKLRNENGAAILIDSFLGFENKCTQFIEIKK